MDKNSDDEKSCEEVDSDELEGDIDLSDEENLDKIKDVRSKRKAEKIKMGRK